MYLSSTTDEANCFEMLGQDNLLSHDMDTLNDGLSKFLTKAYRGKRGIKVTGALRSAGFQKIPARP